MSGIFVTIAVVVGSAACTGEPSGQGEPIVAGTDAPVIIPGGPGDGGRTAQPGESLGRSESLPSAADVVFAESMIPHHRQALEMAALVPDRASGGAVTALAARIAAGQGPEIRVMSSWLSALGRRIPGDHGGHAGDKYGMATPGQLDRLRAARGKAFDELFLRLMITHHEGAVRMSGEELRGGTDRAMRKLAQDVMSGQRVEISRMRGLLKSAEG